MRCICCQTILTEFEAKRKAPDGSYEDLCNSCLTLSDTEAMPEDYGHEYQLEKLTNGSKWFFYTPK